ncbi:MAG: hypothetical protein JJE25_10510 [Bacteroidia bacterium]|nr:hypothetical protein [Bacteroidia bacterium]
MTLSTQVVWLFILAIPIACIAWTVTHEELFREAREYFISRSLHDKTLPGRKFFYLFTCEFCFSFYVTTLILVITQYKLLFTDWRGYFLAGFSLIWIANVYMNLFFFIRIDIKKMGTEAKVEEQDLRK